MTADYFSGTANSAGRRRRRMATEVNADLDLTQCHDESHSRARVAEFAPFPMLSRDRLIRRVISPRLWKHIAAAFVLTLTPIIYAVLTWPPADPSAVSAPAEILSRLQTLKGLSGLKFFVAAQLCLVIAWVRSASVVDFRGRYRWWRWMAVGLFSVSLTLLTNSGDALMHVAADSLEPVFGRLDAARPALIFVPGAACLALLLWQLIPDMGRCRASQMLLVLSVVLLTVRAFAETREFPAVTDFHRSVLELLISGLMLSALQLHARFVIHINPNPPLAVQQASTKFRMTNSVRATEALPDPQTAVPASAVLETTESPEAPVSITDVSAVAAEFAPEPALKSHETLHPLDDTAAKNPTASSGQPPTKAKSGKKQKFRKAG
ncbi:MAG: hypothetical protein KDB01_13880 [Planctomycetaceae bacterium]|nr:hypothetical protein [Planctomycetaceae bacterium]